MLFVVFSIVVPIDVFDYFHTKQQMQDELANLTDQKVLRLAENIQLPLWELDKTWVEKVLLAEMMDEYVFAIKVESENKLFAGKMRNQQWQLVNAPEDILGSYLKRKIEISYKEDSIGFVYLYVTTKFVGQELLSVVIFKTLKTLILSILLVSALNILLKKMVILPLQNILEVINDIANGNYKRSVGSVAENDEIGVLTAAMQRMTKSLSQASEAAIAVAEGDYTHQLEVKGENDLFALSMNNMMLSLSELVKHIDSVSLGNYQSDFDPRSEHDALGIAMQRMTHALVTFDQQKQQQIWLETSVVKLNDVLRKENTLEELAEQVIKVLCLIMGGTVGALFLAKKGDERSRLYLAGCYAYMDTGKNVRGPYQIGEGMIGQVAMDQTRIILKGIIQDDIKIVSGLGSFSPHTVVVSPFSFKQEISGVVEIGFNNEVSDIQQVFLDRTEEAIASAFERIYTRDSLSKALQQAQVFSEELQVANEELLVKTEALEKQTVELKISERISLARAKELEESNRYKSEFLANMSHELRTPLNSLLILAQLLADNEQGGLSADQVESAQIIKSSGQHLLRLINEILELSKVEAGYMIPTFSEVNMAALIKLLQQRFDPLAKEKQLQFQIMQLTELPKTFVSDGQMLDQILTNLLGNAIKFTQQGKVSLSIDFVLVNEGNDGARQWLQFDVSDTGIGIPDQQMDNIFSAFHQVDGGFSRRYGGTGLGLSIASAYAELLGGRIELKSKVNEGSTFSLLLPMNIPGNKVIESKEAHKPTSVELAELNDFSISEPPFTDDRSIIDVDDSVVLVLEDDAKFAKILYQQVKAQGYKCIVSSDAESTMLLVKAYPISGIILDLCLPGMDGKEFLTRLNATPDIQHIPIHVISVMDDDGECWKEGVVGYLTKPVTQQQINDALRVLKHFEIDGPRRVLIVEKDEGQQKELSVLLENERATISISSTIEEAVDMIKGHTFDCIILGVEFIESNGLSLLDEIVENKTIKQPLIIVYTFRELSDEAKQVLKHYEERIVIHHQKSPERLKDEVTLFLHQVKCKKQEGDMFLAYNSDMRLSGKSVMIVDDDMRNSYALAKALRGAGIKVVINSSGQDALNLLSEGAEVDIVLMDIMMPEMDGFETIKKIRSQEKFEKLPIIAVTAKAMPEDKAHCLQAGANDYLVKPIDLNQLMTMIRAWIMN